MALEKHKIYIDFEAITHPFLRKLRWKNESKVALRNIPFAYCIGTFKNQKFYKRTRIVEFHNIDSQALFFNHLRLLIWEDIQKLNPLIENISEVKFFGFAANLEKAILKQLFSHAEVESLYGMTKVSLQKLTFDIGLVNYFPYLQSLVMQKFSQEKINKMHLLHSGVLASLTGMLFFCENKSIRTKYYSDFNFALLRKELVTYLSDDVLRLAYMVANKDKIKKRYNYIIEQRKILNKYRDQQKQLQYIKRKIEEDNFDKKMTVGELLEITRQKINELNNLIDEQKNKEKIEKILTNKEMV